MSQKKSGKRRSLSALLQKKHSIVPVQYEEDLMLHLSKDELFDRHVILPHAEVNPVVYEAVNRFTERYAGEHMTLTIYSDPINESSQQIFREAYISHYEDEYRRTTQYLYRWYSRVILLAAISVAAYYTVNYLAARIDKMNFFMNAITNIGIYCLWEICNTGFKRKDTSLERKRIMRALNAEIRFES